MHIRLFAVGKGRSELVAFESDFLRRMRPFADVQLIELPEGRGKQGAQVRQQEGKRILSRVAEGFILFDERGKVLSSRQWAAFFERQPGNARLDFVIGGASGVSEQVRGKATQCWSLSGLTLPHQLVRPLVLEQCYRAFTIIHGHPYHRE
jgi:23S rRNA (pseudouridine1915-N3)-methyltransferase